MTLSTNAGTLVANARLRILDALDGGATLTVGDLPRRWPETRPLMRHLLDELISEGAVERVGRSPVPGHEGYRITPRGRSRLRGRDEAAD